MDLAYTLPLILQFCKKGVTHDEIVFDPIPIIRGYRHLAWIQWKLCAPAYDKFPYRDTVPKPVAFLSLRPLKPVYPFFKTHVPNHWR